MNLRPRTEWGTIPWAPVSYGRSVLGHPLEVWRPRSTCNVLIFAAIHGEEPETTYALSRALRQLVEPPEHCAVVLTANPDGPYQLFRVGDAVAGRNIHAAIYDSLRLCKNF